MGSEMCIRDRSNGRATRYNGEHQSHGNGNGTRPNSDFVAMTEAMTLKHGADGVYGHEQESATFAGKGKGKTKAVNGDMDHLDGFGDAAADDAAMYDE